jgi:hypothetical protein
MLLAQGGEAGTINFIIFVLTQPGLEPKIYRTWGEHANHYTTTILNWLYMTI